MSGKEMDKTLVLIKPDALKNSLTGYVLSILSEFHTGLCFAATKIVQVNRILADEHYAEHRGKVFFDPLIEYIMGQSHYPKEPNKQRVIAIVYLGADAVKKVRDIAGPTNPHVAREQKPGCVRALGTIVPLKNAADEVVGTRMDNLIHASATDEEAEREIKLWFKPNDIPPFLRSYPVKQSDLHYYYKGKKLFTSHEPGSICLLAPGDLAWESDLDTLQGIKNGKPGAQSLESVAAKYLINEIREV